MADVQHKDIADPEIHEPKGVSTASAGQVYHASGTGTGTWQKVDSTTLKGVTGDSGSTNKKLVSDGTNGFVFRMDSAYGQMNITNNTNNFALTAAADATLNTTTDYVLFTGTGAPWLAGQLHECTFTTDRITVPVTGIYRFNFSASVKAFPTTTAKVGVLTRINASGAFATRNWIAKSGAAGDEAMIAGNSMLSLTAGDYVSVYVASTATGNLILEDVDAILTLVRQTA